LEKWSPKLSHLQNNGIKLKRHSVYALHIQDALANGKVYYVYPRFSLDFEKKNRKPSFAEHVKDVSFGGQSDFCKILSVETSSVTRKERK
jgi:hypothetical protein